MFAKVGLVFIVGVVLFILVVSVQEGDVGTLYQMGIFLGCPLLVWAVWAARGFSQRCEQCGKHRAMKCVHKELLDKEACAITKTLSKRNSKGEVTSTKEVAVPGTRYTYMLHMKCKYCGATSEHQVVEKQEN